MGNVLLIGCSKCAFKNLALHYEDTLIYELWKKENQINLHEAVKLSNLLFICGSKNTGQIIADDIWHMLRNKIVLSEAPEINLKSLRDMYPLSKVARCALGFDADSEKSLFLVSADSDFSDTDLNQVKSILCTVGEVLLVREELFEAILRNITKSAKILASVFKALKDSTDLEKALYEFVIGWVLYGIGSAAIKGNQIEDILPQGSDEKIASLIKETVKKHT